MNTHDHHWSQALVAIHACDEAQAWASLQPSYAEAWASCERGDWLLWLAGRSGDVTPQQLVLAAAAVARTVLDLVPEGEDRPRLAVEAAEAWARGPSEENRRAAGAAATAAAWAARAAEAAEAARAWSAARAAEAAWAAALAALAALAAEAAARAAARAARAAEAAARAAPEKVREQCDAIRAVVPRPEGWRR